MLIRRRRAPLAALCLILASTSACTERSTAPTSSPVDSESSCVPVLDLDAAAMRLAVEEALAIPDRLERVTRLTTLWHNLRLENLNGAIEVFDANVRRSDPLELPLFANAWAHLDPAGASERIRSWRYIEAIPAVQAEIFLTWVLDRGASEPMKWAQENIMKQTAEGVERDHRPNNPNPVLSSMLKAIVLNGGTNEEITPLIEPYPLSNISNSVLRNTILQLRSQGSDRLLSWLESIPEDADNDLSARAWRMGLGIEVLTNLDRGLEWFESREEQMTGLGLLPRVAKGLFGKDRLQAIEWLVARPDSEERTEIFRALTDQWFREDPATAAAWVKEHREIPIVHQVGLAYLTVHILRTDAEKAVAYAVQLPPEQQTPAMKQCLVAWGRRDIHGLKNYLDTHDVSKDVRAIVNIEHGKKLKALESKSGQQEQGSS